MHVWMIINTPHFFPYEPLPLSYVTCWETPACHSDWDRPAIATPALTRPGSPYTSEKCVSKLFPVTTST